MTTTSRQTGTRLAPSDGDDNYIHVVSLKESVWNDTIRRKVPRALCGVMMTGNPDRPELGADAPTCPTCDRLAGPGKRTYIPGKWR